MYPKNKGAVISVISKKQYIKLKSWEKKLLDLLIDKEDQPEGSSK